MATICDRCGTIGCSTGQVSLFSEARVCGKCKQEWKYILKNSQEHELLLKKIETAQNSLYRLEDKIHGVYSDLLENFLGERD